MCLNHGYIIQSCLTRSKVTPFVLKRDCQGQKMSKELSEMKKKMKSKHKQQQQQKIQVILVERWTIFNVEIQAEHQQRL